MRQVIAALCAAVALAGCEPANDPVIEAERLHRCNMYALHDSSRGALGWPDYDGRRAVDCAP